MINNYYKEISKGTANVYLSNPGGSNVNDSTDVEHVVENLEEPMNASDKSQGKA